MAAGGWMWVMWGVGWSGWGLPKVKSGVIGLTKGMTGKDDKQVRGAADGPCVPRGVRGWLPAVARGEGSR
jgi:hypothetical protein